VLLVSIVIGVNVTNWQRLNNKYYKSSRMTEAVKIYGIGENFLEFEEWYELFEDDINIELAEIGADREMDFDIEREFDKRYEMYLNTKYYE